MPRVVALLFKKDELSAEAFREQLESGHVPLFLDLCGHFIGGYRVAYLDPVPSPAGGRGTSPGPDAMAELVFPDDDCLQRMTDHLREHPEVRSRLDESEGRLMCRELTQVFVTRDEYASAGGAARPGREEQLQRLLDRVGIEEAIGRYGSATDDRDWPRLRSLLADDVVCEFAGHEPLVGAEPVVAFIEASTAKVAWNHHKLALAHIEFEGPDLASTLTYHTSHSVLADDPDTVVVKVARYRDTLRRGVDGVWRFTRKVMEPGWNETRHAPQRRPAVRRP